ncbi:hypothetical protein [Parachryseolinea silvisoli]
MHRFVRKGRPPSIPMLYKIAKTLNVSGRELRYESRPN